LTRIVPTRVESLRLETHRRTIQSRLQGTLGAYNLIKVGSVVRGTSISGDSDLDLLAVVPRQLVRWDRRYVTSDTVLDNFRDDLADRYPSTTIRRDVHAIVVSFEGANVDVVPAFFRRFDSRGKPVYSIPNGSGGWMETSPGLYDAYLGAANRASGSKLYNVARLVKFWRICRGLPVPISSFHIEMLLASENICTVGSSYGQCFTAVLQHLARRDCRGLHDPLEISGSLDCCLTEAKRLSAVNSVVYSRDKAKLALVAGMRDTALARHYWNIVFNGKFPT
jgi:hypothetical protein